MTYPLSFRKQVLKVKEREGLSFAGIATRFGISQSSIFRWTRQIVPKKQRNRKWSKIDAKALKNDIEQYPDSYCYERGKRLGCSATGIRDALYRLGVSYKKNPKASQGESRKKIYVLPKDCIF